MPDGFRPIGRNDPCPCGSGRKYKRCCLLRDEAFDAERPYMQAFARQLVRLAGASELAPAVERAWVRFWPDPPARSWRTTMEALELDPAAPEAENLLTFLDWLVHDAPLEGLPPDIPVEPAPDARPGDPPTLVDVFAGMTPPEEIAPDTPAYALLRAWRASVASAFMVIGADPGRGLTLRDIFTDQPYEAREASGSRQLRQGDVVILRMRPLAGLWDISSAHSRYSAAEAPRLREFGAAALERLREEQPDADWARLWKRHGELLHHYVVQRRSAPALPEIRTTTGEPVLLCRAEWRTDEASAVQAALDAHPELERDPDSQQWAWQPEVPANSPIPGGPSFGVLRLGPEGQLVLQTMSAQRHERGRAMVEAAVGDLVHWIGERRRNVTDALADPHRQDAPPAREPAVPAEVLRAAREQVLQELERRWVDEPVPALGGQTPREAAASADPEVRRQLDDVLVMIANASLRAREADPSGASGGMSAARLRALLRWPDPPHGRP